MLFTQDPRGESFDLDSFRDDNLDILRRMYKSAAGIVDLWEEQREATIACLMGAAVLHDTDVIKAEMTFYDEDEERLVEIVQGFVSLVAIFALEENGHAKCVDKKWNLTSVALDALHDLNERYADE